MGEKSLKSLMEAFAGESQANRKYLAYAEQAEKEGYKAAAALFRAVAAAETIHAHSHLRIAGKVGDTRQNLKDALEGEIYEFESMYPEFIKIAQQEGDSKALRSFNFANEVEKVHAQLYKEALENLDKDQEPVKYMVCPTCGYTAVQAPDKCPVCGVPGGKFMEIE
ncbi:MAG TPA: rubrerythrin family protein [Bacillota bacterium]|nr:rubrerythrin family protein [Bacillota bacterium]